MMKVLWEERKAHQLQRGDTFSIDGGTRWHAAKDITKLVEGIWIRSTVRHVALPKEHRILVRAVNR